MPFISVVMPTMRVGGLDVVMHGLDGQTYKDFEFVLVDAFYAQRKDVVARESETREYSVIHVEPIDNPFPLNSFCRYANTGLVHASGEIILFITDYTWLPPSCIAKHAAFHADQDTGASLMCPHQYVSLPELSPDFRPYGHEDIDVYVCDLASGRLDSCMWSILSKPFDQDASKLLSDPVHWDADPKVKLPGGSVHWNMFHAKNESCRTSRILAINGWDEDLDGTHCYQDSDLSDRVCKQAGVSWTLDPSNLAYIVNPRPIFPVPRRIRPVESNLAVWNGKRDAGYPNRVNSWDLSKTRAEALHL